MNYILETERLYMRELTLDDSRELAKVLSDPESMQHYPHLFSGAEVANWILWNLDNYKKYNYGLWAVILKDNEAFIGDCGITMQKIENREVPEIGYHIIKEYRKHGYATEAANACKEYAFNKLGINEIYSYMTVKNIPSQRVAERMGMKFIKSFKKITDEEREIEELLYGINQ